MDAVLFLSDDWVVAIDAALAATGEKGGGGETAEQSVEQPVDDGDRTPGRAVIRYAIADGPDGTGPYDLVVDGGLIRAKRPDGDASVTLTVGWELAVAINQGLESAQGAFLDGRITIGGDPQVLLDNADALGNGNAEVAALRANTVYERS